jgi:PhnB protein
MKVANPYLNFPGNTLEAFEFYRSVFGGEFLGVMRYRDFEDNEMGVPEAELDRIAHIALPLGDGTMLMGTDVMESERDSFTMGTNFYIHLAAESDDEAGRIFDALAAGGAVQMPLQRTEWSQRFGICADRYGVQWMVDHTGEVEFTHGTEP